MPSVNRCICADITFEELKEIGKNLSLDELKKKTQCCIGCGMCYPYIQLMRKTGETSFELMNKEQLRGKINESNR